MSSTHPTDVISEWDELQIKYGNYPERKKVIKNEEISEKLIDLAEQIDPLETKTLRQLKELEDDISESELDLYRQKRLQQLKDQRKYCKFDQVYNINRSEYIDEITNASQNNQVVLLHLYSQAKDSCVLLNRAFDCLARKHRYVKFCRAAGHLIVENMPESQLPTLLVYHNKSCLYQFHGDHIWGGAKHINEDSVEYVLHTTGVLSFASLDSDPRPSRSLKIPRLLQSRQWNNEAEESSSSTDEEEDINAFNKAAKGYTSAYLEKIIKHV